MIIKGGSMCGNLVATNVKKNNKTKQIKGMSPPALIYCVKVLLSVLNDRNDKKNGRKPVGLHQLHFTSHN